MNINETYRNSLGVELKITGIHNIRNRIIIGTIYEGVIRDRDSLFSSRPILATKEGLTDCGYVKIADPEGTP
jgi:hypothetical protein